MVNVASFEYFSRTLKCSFTWAARYLSIIDEGFSSSCFQQRGCSSRTSSISRAFIFTLAILMVVMPTNSYEQK